MTEVIEVAGRKYKKVLHEEMKYNDDKCRNCAGYKNTSMCIALPPCFGYLMKVTCHFEEIKSN